MSVKVLNGYLDQGVSPEWIHFFCPGINNGCPGVNGICPGINGACPAINAACNPTPPPCYTDYCITDCGGSGGVQSIPK
ncbi:MAG: hypothetical protein KGZ53_01260 [Peptococcaceae bacterium]|nr:hypothetical protein [Peptococcaceae bacterium]